VRNLEFTPLKRPKHPGRIQIRLACADVETRGTRDAGFWCGSIASEFGVETYWDESEFFNACSHFDCVYFYNLPFDSNYLRNAAIRSGEWTEFAIDSGTQVLGIVFKHKRMRGRQFRVKDLLPLACGAGKMGLEKACSSYGVEGEKYGRGEAFFNEVSAQRDAGDVVGARARIQKHCELDVILTRALMLAVHEVWAEVFGVNILGRKIYSLPAASLKAYRASGLFPRNREFARRRNQALRDGKTPEEARVQAARECYLLDKNHKRTYEHSHWARESKNQRLAKLEKSRGRAPNLPTKEEWLDSHCSPDWEPAREGIPNPFLLERFYKLPGEKR